MAKEDKGKTEDSSENGISPAQRRRLQQLFDHANQQSEIAQKRGVKSTFDYANDLYVQCVLADPGNMVYAQTMLANLYKKFGGKKGGKFGGFKGAGARSSLKKAIAKKKYDEMLKHGCSVLKGNPWDGTALLAMAEACEKKKMHETQLVYLKGAWIGNQKDAKVNITCAEALARRGRYDEAAECWRRVKVADPTNDEADRAIAKLAVEKTITKGNYEDAESTTDAMADKQEQAERRGEAERQTPEDKFRQAIEKSPEDLSNYLELSELLQQDDQLEAAEKVLTSAVEVSGGDPKIREYLEDVQIRLAKRQIQIAEQRAREDQSEEATELVRSLKAELNRLELTVYQARCDRYPQNLPFRYEVGVRLKRAGKYSEAIKYLQEARGDAKRKGIVHLELGECFQQLKQYKLALSAYETSVEAMSDRELENKKLALYRTGVLATGLRDLDKAEKFLTELAGLDFNYRDVSARLDKISHLRQDE